MLLLINLAAKEIDKNRQSACAKIDTVMENLNDIMMYLEINKSDLPSGSEVSIDELFSLTRKCISEAEDASHELRQQNNWVKAVIESK